MIFITQKLTKDICRKQPRLHKSIIVNSMPNSSQNPYQQNQFKETSNNHIQSFQNLIESLGRTKVQGGCLRIPWLHRHLRLFDLDDSWSQKNPTKMWHFLLTLPPFHFFHFHLPFPPFLPDEKRERERDFESSQQIH